MPMTAQSRLFSITALLVGMVRAERCNCRRFLAVRRAARYQSSASNGRGGKAK